MAVFEAGKASVVLLAGFGFLVLVHHNVQAVAERFVERMHLNPAHHYPRIFIEAAGHLTDARLWLMAGMALLYSTVRVVEAWGLWNERRWAEWFALASTALYLPLEIYEAVHRITWIRLSVLLVNAFIVICMAATLRNCATERVEGSIGGKQRKGWQDSNNHPI